MAFVILLIGLLQSAGVAYWLFLTAKKLNAGAASASEHLIAEVDQKKQLCERLAMLKGEMADMTLVRGKVRELIVARESLKAERGRVTITQAELETIEVRLRELDEIARELEASSTETKEELKILQRKERDLNNKNDALRQQIAQSMSQMDQILSEIEMTAQLQEQVDKMRAELLRSEEQIQTLLEKIQQGNEQYFILKKRYDALDIEYAQLYEKFAEQQQ